MPTAARGVKRVVMWRLAPTHGSIASPAGMLVGAPVSLVMEVLLVAVIAAR